MGILKGVVNALLSVYNKNLSELELDKETLKAYEKSVKEHQTRVELLQKEIKRLETENQGIKMYLKPEGNFESLISKYHEIRSRDNI